MLRILWFNWRDIKNPHAGGAEVFTHEVMRRLAEKGHITTLFTSTFSGCSLREEIDGVEVVRNGGKYGVYKKAKEFYRLNNDMFDIVVDEINTKPFLTPRFVKEKPVVALIHQLAREFWFYETPFPINYIGRYFLEERWLTNYREVPTITVSNSSRVDLEHLGFKKILMVPEGISVQPLNEVPEKESTPTVIFIGRLKKAKLPDHAIRAFELVKKNISDAQMWVIGDGYMKSQLEKSAAESVKFHGFLDSETKYDLLRRAHLILVPAVREGWGLVVTEANALGTPAIGYNVPGIRDSIQDGITGILTGRNTPEELANQAIRLLTDRQLLYNLSRDALVHSKQFSWDLTADRFDQILGSLGQTA